MAGERTALIILTVVSAVILVACGVGWLLTR